MAYKEAPKSKAKKKRSNDTWLTILDENLSNDMSWRDQLEKEWMINSAYYRGKQNIKYDPRYNRLTFERSDPLRFYVNLIYPTVRVVRAAITRNAPTWDIDALPYGSITPEQRDLVNEFMASLYDKLGLKQTLKEMVFHGLITGIGILQYGFDADDDNGEGELYVEALDPFDVYIGGRAATRIQDADRITKVVRRSISYLEQKEKEGIYKNVSDVKTDSKAAESKWKDLLVKEDEGQENDDDTVILRESWVKEDGKITVVTWTEGVVLRVEETDWEEFPFCIWQPDVTPGTLYNEGWVSSLVPLNKAINYIERKILKHNVVMATGKYVTDQDSGVKMVNNEIGEIVKIRSGAKFEQMSLAPMSNTPFNQLNNLNRYFSDISGVQDAMLGRAPTGVTAAVAFETLVSNALANLTDLLDNLTITLEELGEQLLKLAYDRYSVTKEFRLEDSHGREKIIKIGGKDASMKEDKDAVRLPERMHINVQIADGIANTRQGKIETMFQLRAQGDIDRRTLLENLGLDTTQIEARLFEESQGGPISQDGLTEEEIAQQSQQAPPAGAPQGAPAGAPQGEDPAMLIEAFLTEAEAAGIRIDPALLEDPEALLGIIDGSIPSEVIDGVLTVAA